MAVRSLPGLHAHVLPRPVFGHAGWLPPWGPAPAPYPTVQLMPPIPVL